MIIQFYIHNKLTIYLALVLTILTCMIESTIYGQLGTKQYSSLANQYSLLKENIEDLNHLNKELKAKKESLENNSRDIILAARKVGYFKKGEKRIIIDGLKTTDKELEIGYLLQSTPIKNQQKLPFIVNFVVISLTYFFIIYFISLFLKKREPVYVGSTSLS